MSQMRLFSSHLSFTGYFSTVEHMLVYVPTTIIQILNFGTIDNYQILNFGTIDSQIHILSPKQLFHETIDVSIVGD